MLCAAAVMSLAGLLAGCGGDTGTGSSSPVPTPAPSPSPAPTASPTPTATRFSVVAVGPVASSVYLDTSGDGIVGNLQDSMTPTTMDGEFGQNVAVSAQPPISGQVPAEPILRMEASGVDTTSGFVYINMAAPVGATVISPLSALIDAAGSEARVRAALGLDTGANALRAETRLLTFNPALSLGSADAAVKRDAERLTTVNLQLLVMASLLKEFPGDLEDSTAPLANSSRILADYINAGSKVDLTDAATLKALISRGPGADPVDRLDLRAGLLAKYMTAMPARIGNFADGRAWAYAFRFFVFPEMRRLGSFLPGGPTATAIAAISGDDIAASAAWFRPFEVPKINGLVAAPDYRELTSWLATPYALTMDRCEQPGRLPSCNDWRPFVGLSPSQIETAVSANTAGVAVSLMGTTLKLERVGAFTGLTHATYTARSADGASATGTMFVRVRPAETH